MATIIDITSKIRNEEKYIQYGKKKYKVDDSKNAMIRVSALMDDSADVETIDKIITILLGKDAVKDFSGFALSDYKVVLFAALACVQEVPYEDVERSFRASSDAQ